MNTEKLPWEQEEVVLKCSRSLGEEKTCGKSEGMEVDGGWCNDCKTEFNGEERKVGRKWTIPTMQARLKELGLEARKKRQAEILKKDVARDTKEFPELF